MSDIIGMDDMMAVYGVTDAFGIDRESISVPLEKVGGGGVERRPGGDIEIVVPASITTEEWLPALRATLERLGFEPAEPDDDWDE